MTTTIQAMSLSDLEMLLEWAATEGWNPGLDDAKAFYAADPHGYLMVCQDTQPAACISVVKQGTKHGFLIGPVNCDDAAIAEQLIRSLVKRVNAQTITLDVPEPHYRAMELAASIGLQPVFETARMYRGQAPTINLNQLFGVTTLELG